jgi:hypothetical protein
VRDATKSGLPFNEDCSNFSAGSTFNRVLREDPRRAGAGNANRWAAKRYSQKHQNNKQTKLVPTNSRYAILKQLVKIFLNL